MIIAGIAVYTIHGGIADENNELCYDGSLVGRQAFLSYDNF